MEPWVPYQQLYTQSKASGERVLELLNTPVDVQETEDPIIVEADQVKGACNV